MPSKNKIKDEDGGVHDASAGDAMISVDHGDEVKKPSSRAVRNLKKVTILCTFYADHVLYIRLSENRFYIIIDS